MVILGIDPGSRKTGFGLIKKYNKKIEYIASGCLRYDKLPDFMGRLSLIYSSCKELVKRYQPDEIAIESLIYVKSVPALAKLAQARGSMIAAFSETHEKKIFEYSPNLVKSTVSGHGHASKESIEKSLKMIFGQSLDFKTNDESDALAIALCHELMREVPRTFKGHAKSSRGGTSLKKAFKHLE